MKLAEYGYTGKILLVDLTSGKVSNLPTSAYAGRFLGGRGIAARIYWDMVNPQVKALDPENCLIFITGPLAGFTRFAGCRWQICGNSPQTEPNSFSYANLGESWGAWLKYAGYDGLVVTGKATQPVYLYIDDDRVELRDASTIWGKTTINTKDILQSELGKQAKILEIGPAAENLVSFATILAADHASGSSGFGSVMGSKRLKAIVVNVNEKKRPLAADPEMLQTLAKQVYQLRTRNPDERHANETSPDRLSACYGCINGCHRRSYEIKNGKHFKSFCQAMLVYREPAMKYYDNGNEVSRLATRLCDTYGLDTIVMEALIRWLGQCYEAGILSDEESGLPLSRIGSSEFIETLVRKISFRKDFGDILAQGTLKAAEYIGKGAEKLIVSSGVTTKANETRDYDPRLIIVNALLYATDPRRPIQLLHATVVPLIRWFNWQKGRSDAFLSTEILRDIAKEHWGSAAAADFSSYAGKALAAKKIQDYGYAKESLILCDIIWPIYFVNSADKNIGLGILESQIVSAVTGRKINEIEFMKIGERNFNLQRAILLRQGWGGRGGDTLLDYLHKEPLQQGVYFSPECLVPDKDGKLISRKGAVVEREGFERMKDEYYMLRGWDVESGLPTRARFEELGLPDLCVELEKAGLLK